MSSSDICTICGPWFIGKCPHNRIHVTTDRSDICKTCGHDIENHTSTKKYCWVSSDEDGVCPCLKFTPSNEHVEPKENGGQMKEAVLGALNAPTESTSKVASTNVSEFNDLQARVHATRGDFKDPELRSLGFTDAEARFIEGARYQHNDQLKESGDKVKDENHALKWKLLQCATFLQTCHLVNEVPDKAFYEFATSVIAEIGMATDQIKSPMSVAGDEKRTDKSLIPWRETLAKFKSSADKFQYLSGLSKLSWDDCQDAWYGALELIPEVSKEIVALQAKLTQALEREEKFKAAFHLLNQYISEEPDICCDDSIQSNEHERDIAEARRLVKVALDAHQKAKGET